MLFAIPFEEAYTLLGTTEVEMRGDPGPVAITPGEVDYICATANTYFKKPLSPGDVVWSYSGVRPLLDDLAQNTSAITRDYVLHLDRGPAPMLSVYGGKITTCRRLAEQAVDMLAGPLGFDRPAWPATPPSPAGTSATRTPRDSSRVVPSAIRGLREKSSATMSATTAPGPTPSLPAVRASATSERGVGPKLIHQAAR